MTSQATTPRSHPRSLWLSTGAIVPGFFAVVLLSLGADGVLHVLKVYPPWGQPMREPGLNLLALAYRIVFGVVGSYITASLAPHSPMRHALIGGGIGFLLSTAGVIAGIQMDLGPLWYPIALALTALPCAWLGGALYSRRAGAER